MAITANIFAHGLKDNSPDLRAIIDRQKLLFECGINFWQDIAENGYSQECFDGYVDECINVETERGNIQKGYLPSTALYLYSIFAPHNTENALSFDKIYERNVHLPDESDDDSENSYLSGLRDVFTYLDEQHGYYNIRLFEIYNSALRTIMANTGYVKKDKYTIDDIISLSNTLSFFGDEDNDLKGSISQFVVALNILAGDKLDKTRSELERFVDNNYDIAKKFNLNMALDDLKCGFFIRTLITVKPELGVLRGWKINLNLWHEDHVLEYIDKYKNIILAKDSDPLLDYISKSKNEMKNEGSVLSRIHELLRKKSSEGSPRLKM